VSFWEINSDILSKQYPGLLEEITGKSDHFLAPEEIQTENAASGELSLRVRGVYVHSPRDPVREGQRLAQTINTGAGPVIILGFGLGYAAQAAAELAPDRPIIIVEKYGNLLAMALQLRDLTKLLSRSNVAFAPGSAGEGVTRALSFFSGDTGEKIQPVIIRNRALVDLDEEWYGAVESRIQTYCMKDDVNMATLRRFGKRWVRNLSRNMVSIRDLPGVSHIAGLAGETLPVFLAAAGPSLDLAGPLLREIRQRCIVIAVDTSLRFLLKNSVHPDFAVVVDPQFWNSRHLDRCSCQRTRLIAESAVYPPVLRLPFSGCYLCGSLFPLGSFVEKRVDPKGQLGAGGSVATTAWDFARTLGAREIWIAGLDLAFPDLKTHFRGALFEDRSNSESQRLMPAETWLVRALRDGIPFRAPSASGGQVFTDRRLSLYAAWFENRFRQFPEIRNYSLFSGGLAINGLEPVNIENILALPDRRNEIDRRLEEAFSKIEADFNNTQEKQEREERFENAVSVLLNGLERIKNAAEKGVSIAEQALKRSQNSAEQDRILKKLDEITRLISESDVKEAAGFLFPSAETGETDKDPFRAFLKSSIRLYNLLAEAVEFNLHELRTNYPLKSRRFQADTVYTGRANLS